MCEHGNVGPEETVQVRKVAGGKNHTVVLSTENEVWAWGSGTALGVEGVTSSSKPILVDGLIGRNVLDVVCGELYTVALVEKSVLDETPKIRTSSLEKTPHKYYPTTCAKCNEEIYSYTETQDTCIISESHVCAETGKNSSSLGSDQSEPLIHLQECTQTEIGRSENCAQKEEFVTKEDNSGTMKTHVLEGNISIPENTAGDKSDCDRGDNSGEICSTDRTSEGRKLSKSKSDENVWQKQNLAVERSISSKSDHVVSRSRSFIDEKNARKFLAKQLDEDEVETKNDGKNEGVRTAVMDKVGGIWSSVQTGSTNIVQTAYALPEQMSGMLGTFKTSLIDRMSSVSANMEQEESGSSIDSNIHLVGFDTSDEDVFHATQLVESRLSREETVGQSSQKTTPKKLVKLSDAGSRPSSVPSTPKHGNSENDIAETTFVESVSAEMQMQNDSKLEDQGEATPSKSSTSGEATPKYRSIRTILAKQAEMERKISTRSSSE